MKRICLILLGTCILASSCQKSVSDFDPSSNPGTGTGTMPPTTGSGSFVATINGKQYNFNITAASLLRSTASNEKRMDITGTSTDNTQRIILTLGEETSQGNAVSVKSYALNAFPVDDPNTPNIDESLYTQGFTTYGTGTNNNWIYGIYDENGACTITSCNASTQLVSGNFETQLVDMIDPTHVVQITKAVFSNIKYTVLN